MVGFLSLRNKLVLLLTTASAISIAVSTSAILYHDLNTTRTQIKAHVQTLAEVVGENSMAAIMFRDQDAAYETLQSLLKEPSIETARLYDANGNPFSTLIRNRNSRYEFPPTPPPEGCAIEKSALWCCLELTDSDGLEGWIYIRANIKLITESRRSQVRISLLILLGTLCASALVAIRMQRVISDPILSLASAARNVQQLQDFTIRVKQKSKDEVGWLTMAFNDMLEQIESSRESLHRAHAVLEQRVRERTEELTESNRQLHHEINKHKRSKVQLEQLQKELVETARSAGMADIATGVLHNVGNVLNSINVSVGLMSKTTNQYRSHIQSVHRIAELLHTHHSDLGPFFSEHPQGKHVIGLLQAIAKALSEKHEEYTGKIQQLRKHIVHIKQIVASQQALAKLSGMMSEVSFTDLFDEAVKLNSATMIRHEIRVERNYYDRPRLVTDKHRVLQILVNLISNAKHSLATAEVPDRVITLEVVQHSDVLLATVRDNGVGISEENLDKIFQFGFTTREEGHGFGLHTSAIAASELGGSLAAQSPGLNSGAEFILTLPLRRSDSKQRETVDDP